MFRPRNARFRTSSAVETEGARFAALRKAENPFFHLNQEPVMANTVAKKMSEASNNMQTTLPRKGDRFRCSQCGMELQLTADCRCKEGEHVHFECCGQEMTAK